MRCAGSGAHNAEHGLGPGGRRQQCLAQRAGVGRPRGRPHAAHAVPRGKDLTLCNPRYSHQAGGCDVSSLAPTIYECIWILQQYRQEIARALAYGKSWSGEGYAFGQHMVFLQESGSGVQVFRLDAAESSNSAAARRRLQNYLASLSSFRGRALMGPIAMPPTLRALPPPQAQVSPCCNCRVTYIFSNQPWQ